jgi:hypothetical protein
MSGITNHVDSATAVAVRPRRRRRWIVWAGLLFTLFLLLVVGANLLFIYWADAELREAMAAADRDSPDGWQLEQIDARREDVADDENAALVVLKVNSLLPLTWPAPAGTAGNNDPVKRIVSFEDKLGDLPPNVQLPKAMQDALRANLDSVKPARAEARKLIGMTKGRFPIANNGNILVMTLSSSDARQTADLLRYEAALASQSGDVDSALAFVRGLLGTARAIGDEPYVVSGFYRLGCDAKAVNALEQALAQGEPSAQELERVQKLLEEEANEPFLARAMRGERAGLHKLLVALSDGEASMAQVAGGGAGMEARILNASGPMLARRSHARILTLMNEGVEASELPGEQQAAVMDDIEKKVVKAKSEFDIVINQVFPALNRISAVYGHGVGNLRCALVGVALERYRRDHGAWPENLDALIPTYLNAIPSDPQDGKPLRYKRNQDGVLVYWVGLDSTDNGGKLDRTQNYLAQGVDWGFQLWDVKGRHKPAPVAKKNTGP